MAGWHTIFISRILSIILMICSFSAGCPDVCKCKVRNVDCSNKGLRHIPDFSTISDTVYKADLRSNSLDKLTATSFQHLVYVQSLILQYNNINEIEEGTFSGLNSLKALDLSGNRIARLPKDIFMGLTNLHYLDLSQNYLVSLDGVLSGLTSLHRLVLGHNKLAALTDNTFRDLQKLMYLIIGNNRIARISSNAFSPLTNMSYLVLKTNPLYNVDNKFLNNHRMSYIDLTNCKLQHIPQGLPWVIRYLQLTNNNISSVTKDDFRLYRFIGVTVLDQNQISHIEPGAFSHMGYLRELWINGNKLTSIPEQLPLKLRFLYLDGNDITTLNDNIFTGRTNLLTFSVKGNNLHKISGKDFDKMSEITKLYLDNNNLTEIDDFTFKSLAKLERLFISRNPLQKLKRYSFFGLHRLKYLQIAFVTTEVEMDEMIFSQTPALTRLELQYSNTLAKTIISSMSTLKTLSNLTELNLMSAELSTLSSTLKNELPYLIKLHIADNKWHCDKALLWLNHWMRLAKTLFVNKMDIKCFSPRRLHGVIISSMFDSQFVPTTTTEPTPLTTSNWMTTTDTTLSATQLSDITTQVQSTSDMRVSWSKSGLETTPTSTSLYSTEQPRTTPVSITAHDWTRQQTRTSPVTLRKWKFTNPVPPSTGTIPMSTQVVVSATNKTLSTSNTAKQPLPPSTEFKTITASRNGRITTPGITQESVSSTPSLTTKNTSISLPDTDSRPDIKLNSSATLTESNESGGDNSTVIAIASSLSVVVLILILIALGYFVFRYRRNKLIYHRAIHYQQHHDMMYFITLSESETKPIKGPNRSDRGSVSSVTSEDITNEGGGIKVYHWDEKQ